MNIKWRDSDYEYTPRMITGGKDKEHHTNTIDAPICGADTESVELGERYEPQCFQVSTPWGDELLYVPEQAVVLEHFLDYMMMFEDEILETGRHCMMYFHNLEYDWLQMVKYHPLLLEMSRIGVGPDNPVELSVINNRRIILQKNALFTGNAPHFTLRIQKNKNHFFNIHFRDTWSFFPTSLEKVAKDLQLSVKKRDRDAELGRIDFRTYDAKDQRRIDFEDYSIDDARVTRLAAEKIRDLHREYDMRKIRVSGPSYAISVLFHMMDETESIVSGKDDQKMMQLIFDTYRGGRTGGVYHGRVDNVSVLDFHSSYPASMCSLPSFSERTGYVWVEDLSVENVMNIIKDIPSCFLRVDGVEHDAKYPGLIMTHDGKLTPVHGEFENVATTGVELCVAIQSGTLELKRVREMVVVFDLEDGPLPFKEFATRAYERKAASEKGTAEYLSSKLELNSAYGKLIESRYQVMIGARDGSVILPFPADSEKEFASYYYDKYVSIFRDGKSFFDEYDNVIEEVFTNMQDIHEQAREENNQLRPFEEEWESWTRIRFSSMSISGKTYGFYVVPAAASLITATSRARLCAAMKALGALYWDTDSVFVKDLDMDSAKTKLEEASAWLPKGIIPLAMGDELGLLDCEISGAWGFLAGTKRYYLSDGENVKKAIHGIPSLPYEQVEKTIESLATGSDFAYMSKPKPLKSKEAKDPNRIGAFEAKTYQPLFHLDERLEWTETETGWEGKVKSWDNLGVCPPEVEGMESALEDD